MLVVLGVRGVRDNGCIVVVFGLVIEPCSGFSWMIKLAGLFTKPVLGRIMNLRVLIIWYKLKWAKRPNKKMVDAMSRQTPHKIPQITPRFETLSEISLS